MVLLIVTVAPVAFTRFVWFIKAVILLAMTVAPIALAFLFGFFFVRGRRCRLLIVLGPGVWLVVMVISSICWDLFLLIVLLV